MLLRDTPKQILLGIVNVSITLTTLLVTYQIFTLVNILTDYLITFSS